MSSPRHARTTRRRINRVDRTAVVIGLAVAAVAVVLIVAVLAGWDTIALVAVAVLGALMSAAAGLCCSARGPS